MKRWFRYPIPILMATLLAACGDAGDHEAVESAAPGAAPDVDPAQIMTGAQAYEQICANCHEQGVNGAPRTGDPDAWADRSPLWEAVLFEHARSGFLDMPAKGGVDALEYPIVTRAAEHMLAITFPDARPNSSPP